jgi:succinate dehydrogenase flavin-adding protein (antitoxin of CptAB toxin-antitoxin module)
MNKNRLIYLSKTRGTLEVAQLALRLVDQWQKQSSAFPQADLSFQDMADFLQQDDITLFKWFHHKICWPCKETEMSLRKLMNHSPDVPHL